MGVGVAAPEELALRVDDLDSPAAGQLRHRRLDHFIGEHPGVSGTAASDNAEHLAR
jgi:hypothetical protein